MIRVCPLKDRACPNGMDCTEPCARDQYYDPNSKPSQDARGTARHNNKSPCTDGEVEKLKDELAKSREYATSLLTSGLDLKARAERAEAELHALKARVAELEAGLNDALQIIDPIADVVKAAGLYATLTRKGRT